MPAPPMAFPGQKEHVRLRDQLEATAQECPICPRNVLLSLQHFFTGGQGTAARCPGSAPAPSPSTRSICPHSPLQITFSFSRLCSLECCIASPRERALIRPPLPNTLPGAQTAAPPALLLPLPSRRQGQCPRADLSKAPIGATSVGKVYLGAAGLHLAVRAGPKEGPRVGLTNEFHSLISQRGLRIFQVWQILPKVFIHCLPVLLQLEKNTNKHRACRLSAAAGAVPSASIPFTSKGVGAVWLSLPNTP